MKNKFTESLYLLIITFITFESFIFILLLNSVLCNNKQNENLDYYQLLGISKDADNRDIRKAFKKLALVKHPDKNQNDPNSHQNFVKITRAYEVLKDEEMRKKYDTFGEEGLKDEFNRGARGQYHSWNYYNDEFGIYDNDEEIITLSKTDFEQSVENSANIWFINFYSPQCSHCHHLAPDWRKLAKELEGTIRIGAVNCEEDWILCRQQSVRSYPTLKVYPEREIYNGKRDVESMVDYVLNKLNPNIITIDELNLNTFYNNLSNYSLLIFCYQNKDCIFSDTKKKVSTMLEKLIDVGEVYCDDNQKSVCDYFGITESKVALFQNIRDDPQNYYQISSGDQSIEAKEIFRAVLSKLPNVKKLTQKDVKSLMEDLSKEKSIPKPWIIQFTTTEKDIESHQIETKRLVSLLSDINVGKVYCDKEPKVCAQFYIHKYPSFVVLKSGPNYELYHGRILAFDIITFAKESLSSQLQTLDPNLFEDKVTNPVTNIDKPWIVDFFAPWCPPCMSLMSEVRKASRSANHLVNFGIIDCTVHSSMCRKYSIRSYPTVLLYNSSIAHQFYGSHSEHDLVEFIHETLFPTVIQLTPDSYNERVENRKANSIWLIDFYAPWCGPCQRLAPQWTKLAKLLKEETNVNVAQVNCQTHQSFCSEVGVRSYPTIRLYPSKSTKTEEKFFAYKGNNRDTTSLRVWTYGFIPTAVKEINTEELFNKVLKSKNIWLIDYYTPWCSHCQTFSPELELISKKLKGKIITGKVNCQSMRSICRNAAINAYPTLKLYMGSKSQVKQNAEGVDVQGFVAKDVIQYVLQILSTNDQMNVVRDEL